MGRSVRAFDSTGKIVPVARLAPIRPSGTFPRYAGEGTAKAHGVSPFPCAAGEGGGSRKGALRE